MLPGREACPAPFRRHSKASEDEFRQRVTRLRIQGLRWQVLSCGEAGCGK